MNFSWVILGLSWMCSSAITWMFIWCNGIRDSGICEAREVRTLSTLTQIMNGHVPRRDHIRYYMIIWMDKYEPESSQNRSNTRSDVIYKGITRTEALRPYACHRFLATLSSLSEMCRHLSRDFIKLVTVSKNTFTL